jgi:gluconolactonase
MTVLKSTFVKSLAIISLVICFSQASLAQTATETETPAQAAETTAVAETAAEDAPTPLSFSVADGALNFTTTGTWKSVKPKSRILEYEIQVPRAENDNRDGRLTIMGAGGSIEANVARWEGQFSQPDGSPTKAEVTEETVEGMKVTMVDISGSYIETMGGPFSGGKKVESPDFRVLAAIIETPESGNYFVKLIGPKATIGGNEKAFIAAIKGIKLKK